MNTEGVGDPILKVVDKKGKKKDVIYYLTDNIKNVKHPINELKVDSKEYVQLIPVKTKERSCRFITGQSGAGKSYFTKSYLEEYHKMYPKRLIYLFSFFSEDKSLDSLKYLKRIKLGPEFCNMALTIDDFKDSCVILDDVDFIKDRAIKQKLFTILDTLLQGGRHANVEVIYTSHVSCAGKDTRIILGEASSVTIFPRTMGNRALNYLLGEYFGLSSKQIERVRNLDSRAVTITRTYPPYVIYQNGAFPVSELK